MTLRRDLHVYNEATGWVLTSGTRNGHAEKDFTSESGAKWKTAIEDGSIVPLGLYQDDAFDVRVVVGGALTTEEQEEWVDRLTWKLAVPDGRLVITAGSEWLSGDDPDDEHTRSVDIPAGRYQVDVYTFLPGVNGEPCLAKAGVREAGVRKWFAKTRPGMKPPAWLVRWIGEDPPSPEEQARRDAFRKADDENSAAQKVSWRVWSLDEPPAPTAEPVDERVPLDFLVHLTPLGAEPALPALKKGWFSHIQSPRKPERCPLGIYSEHVPETRTSAKTKEPSVPSVTARVQNRPLAPLAGGAVPLRVTDELALPFWVANMCRSDPWTELRIDLHGADFAVQWPPEGSSIVAARSDEGWTIAITHWGHHAVRRLHRLGGLLAGLPNGATLEMNVAPGPSTDDAELAATDYAGVHRYRGEVRDGVWHVAETSMPIDRAALLEALELAREVDAAGPITARSAEEADAIWTAITTHGTNYKMSKLFGTPRLRREGLSFVSPEIHDLLEAADMAFRTRFAGVWPIDRS